MIVSLTDFVADYCISTDDYTSADLEKFISKKEVEVISHLLGANLYVTLNTEFNDNNGILVTQRLIDIFNEGVLSFGCTEYYYCGMKNLIAKAMFFKYAIHQRNINTISGNIQHKHEVASSSAYSKTELARIWNEFKCEASILQRYILSRDDFDDYRGKEFKGSSII